VEIRPHRTVLEQKIRERQQTFEEFAEHVETFAREHNEPGTLSVRHLQRLVAGRRPDGRPLGAVQPATARLLEHVLGLSIDELLSPPPAVSKDDGSDIVLRQWLHASRQVDKALIATLQDQLAGIRRIDRQLGAVATRAEVRTKIDQVETLLTHSISAGSREPLAALLSELYCLAGWQALDIGKPAESWLRYERASMAARESTIQPYMAVAAAGRAIVLVDVQETVYADDLLRTARDAVNRKCSRLVRSWLAATHGEVLAAGGMRDDCLRAFDAAAALLPVDTADDRGPYVALNPVHLARWRGHALARCDDPEAIDVLNGALIHLDPTFVRAETGLRADLATALVTAGQWGEASTHIQHARDLAMRIGSTRQLRRIDLLTQGNQPNVNSQTQNSRG
jgi:hypothetical protein